VNPVYYTVSKPSAELAPGDVITGAWPSRALYLDEKIKTTYRGTPSAYDTWRVTYYEAGDGKLVRHQAETTIGVHPAAKSTVLLAGESS
jgi:hypothetical protein